MYCIKIIFFIFIQKITNLSFALTGDIATCAQGPSLKKTFIEVSSFLREVDLCIGNLEGVLCKKTHVARRKGTRSYNFRMDLSFANTLSKAGFDILNIANNHSMDYGQSGLTEMLHQLEKSNLLISGKRDTPVKIKLRGQDIWIVGFSTYAQHNSILNIKNQCQWIRELKKACDILIITFHAGAEGDAHMHVRRKEEQFFGENRGNVFAFARNAIDHGADMVFGHGPHVLRGIEIYKNKLIAYSLGNFVGAGYLSCSGQKYLSTIMLSWLNKNGDFMRGKIIPITLAPDGNPHVDSQKRSISLIKNLSEKDFPKTHPEIRSNGEFFKNDL